MKIQIEFRRPRWLPARLSWRARIAVTVVAALAVAVPVAWASHQFGDVPDSQPFHSQISAIALAGITTGCGGGNYCPADAVRRDAMAAFMHRGMGRMTWSAPDQQLASASEVSFTQTITPGLPSGALADAAGFVKTDGSITLELTDATGCPCTWGAELEMDGVGSMTLWFSRATLVSGQPHITIPITGGITVTTAGPKTVRLNVFHQVGGGTVAVRPTLSSTYYPFGGTGTNALGTQSAPAADPPAGAGPSRN